MTIQDVKNNLPDVKIFYCGKIFTGHVRGRLNPFATVFIDNKSKYGLQIEFAWQSIAKSIEEDKPLFF